MATSVNTASTNDDNDEKNRNPKKGRDIQPLNEDAIKKQLENDKEFKQSNSDVLAELAARTAELAEHVRGPESPKERVLKLDEPEDADPKDIYAALDEKMPKAVTKVSLSSTDASPAVELIRAKLNKLYSKEPDATDEAAKAVVSGRSRSKHQQFMYDLTTSGKSLAEIQTSWHNYYVDLPDDEKHAVWQEFYRDQSSISSYTRHQQKINPKLEKKEPKRSPQNVTPHKQDYRDPSTIRTQIKDKVSAGGKLKPIHHVKSALFGVGLAGIVGLAITFIFFNQVFVAPFISPSKTVSATPIIGNNPGEVGPESKIIIPKINLEVPVVYDLNTVDEKAVQNALEDGVVHYASTPEPGEIGNIAIVGHSSNNILNSGKYKFAFVLLRRLEKDDTFFLHKDGIRYTYKIYDKRVVPPTDVSVLGPADKPNTVTLITCDPPGTSVNRLVVVAEQISPDTSGNTKATIDIDSTTEELPSNAQSLWSRLTSWL